MALAELWKSSPEQLDDKHVQQIIAFAGDGKLRDNAAASREFRDFLSIVPSLFLQRYADNCLSNSFQDSGLALQDIVNEIGRRLSYSVNDGYYRGRMGKIGFDGLWRSKTGHAIVLEVKTTDAYRVDLGTVAEYRRKLIKEQAIEADSSSILVVVGRQNTGDLEAQIRGSKHAWDIRLLSVASLVRLMYLKEKAEDPEIIRKIGEILIPQEFTRLDSIIDLVFSTTEDVLQDEALEDSEEEDITHLSKEKEPKFVPSRFHDACIEKVKKHLNISLVKESRVTYSSPDDDTRVICAVSKTHISQANKQYWFAFHPHQRSSLSESQNGFLAFGCGSADQVLLIAYPEFEVWLEGLNQTVLEDRSYWHVKITREENNFFLKRKVGSDNVNLSQYLITG